MRPVYATLQEYLVWSGVSYKSRLKRGSLPFPCLADEQDITLWRQRVTSFLSIETCNWRSLQLSVLLIFHLELWGLFISICFDWMRYSLKFIIFLPFTISLLSAMSVPAISEVVHQFSQAVAMRVLTLVYGKHKNILFPMCTSHFPNEWTWKRVIIENRAREWH